MKVVRNNKNLENQRIAKSNNTSFLLISNMQELKDASVPQFDGIIVDTENSDDFDAIILFIRNHKDARIYLKPVFTPQTLKGISLNEIHCDGYTDLIHFTEIERQASKINKKIKSVTVEHNAPNYDLEALFKTIQYQYTRNSSLHPINNRHAKTGYLFPFISLFYKDNDSKKMIEILEKGQKAGYFSTSVLDKIHLCNSCSGSYLHFRETCTKCSSIDLKSDDMIHHFVCATVAPESDFVQGEDLCCPKCDKHLRHIGIDYDKPSSIYTCNTCDERFQNTHMKALCVDCHQVNELSELEGKSINSYTVTGKGEQLAMKGFQMTDTNKVPETPNGLVNMEFFHMLLQQESLRVEGKTVGSFFGKVELKSDAILKLNNTMKDILKNEVATSIKGYLDPADVLALDDYKTFYFLMPDCSMENANEKLDTIQYNINKLLSHNLTDGKDSVHLNCLPIRTNAKTEELILAV